MINIRKILDQKEIVLKPINSTNIIIKILVEKKILTEDFLEVVYVHFYIIIVELFEIVKVDYFIMRILFRHWLNYYLIQIV